MTRVIALLLAMSAPAIAIERVDGDATILTMKRLFIEPFGGGETAAQIRDMIISSLQSSHIIQITENPDRADVVLKGSGEDLVFTEDHISSDNLNIHTNSSSGAFSGKSSASNGIVAGENESSHISERKHESSAAVRIVNRQGDVIWSTTKESQGGKFHGASADVADKMAKQLVHDISAAKQAGKPLL